MHDWAECYRRLDAPPAGSGAVAAWHSPAAADPWWDDFLRRTPCGQFQQSGLWAEYKAAEGWNHHRVVLTGADGITGGFQILWKKARLGRIGYVSKGPVAHPESEELVRQLETLLAGAAKELGLTALIAQSPDESRDAAGPGAPGFVQSNPVGVIEATYLVDVSAGMEVVRSRMHPKVRQYVRKARQQGVTIREGTEADIPGFFDLMAATCRRQKTSPNPASVEAVRLLWRIFSPSQSIEMAFAEREGVVVGARLNLLFGERMTLWKKGWTGGHGDWHPNELLADNSFEWAHARGFRICDFCAIDRETATEILGGRPAVGAAGGSRDAFNLRLGGYPKLLPRARVLIPNPLLRWGYRNLYARREQRRHRQKPDQDGPAQT